MQLKSVAVRKALWKRLSKATTLSAAVFGGVEALESRMLLSAGQLDTTFAEMGLLHELTLPGATAFAVQADGKMVEASQFLGHLSLARFNVDGSPDVGFGYFGRLTSELGNVISVGDLALQTDGRIIVVGGAGQNFLVTRYNANGSLDTGFGQMGVVTTDFGSDDVAHAVALTHSGQIVVAGISVASFPQSSQMAVARYNANGALDKTFGNQGMVLNGGAGIARDSVDDVAVGADNKPVVVGAIFGRGGLSFLIQRFNSDGSPDGTNFGTPSRVSLQQEFNSVAIQGDGKIVAAGEANNALVRFNSDGTLDNSFGNRGAIDPTLGIGQNLSTAALRDVLLQSDGKIVVGGTSDLQSPHDFYIARYDAAGKLDGTFGTNGIVDTPLGYGERLTRIAFGPDGTIVAAGGSGSQLDLARYTGDGSVAPAGGTIRGIVYEDANGNGVRDPGETAVVGRQVYLDLQGINTLTASDPIATTDAQGRYTFSNLPVANYLVRLVPQFGQIVTAPLFGAKYFVQLGQNQNVTGEDFGTKSPGAQSGSIRGKVYDDVNGNGAQDANESGLEGRQVYLDLQGLGVFNSGDPITISDADGRYAFSGLPTANYLVRLVPQPGRVISAPLYGGKFFVQLGPGQNVSAEDFGTQAVGRPNLLQDDGKLLVLARGHGSDFSTVLMRYNSDGSADIPFGDRGAAKVGGPSLFGSNFDQIMIRPDGKVLVAWYDNTGFVTSNRLTVLSADGLRLNSATIAEAIEGMGKSVTRLAVAPDNRIIVGGTQLGPGGLGQFVQRYNADLSIDIRFGKSGDGTVIVPGVVQLLGLRVLVDNSIVLTYANQTVTLSSMGIIL